MNIEPVTTDPHFGGQLVCLVTDPPAWSWARIAITQGAMLVDAQYVRVGGLGGVLTTTPTFTLGPTTNWTAGAAKAHVELGIWAKSGKWRQLDDFTIDIAS